jgi:5-methylcytosine-specific restriction enzyme subunit McrC
MSIEIISRHEHCQSKIIGTTDKGVKLNELDLSPRFVKSDFKESNKNLYCFNFKKNTNDNWTLETGYFIGVDWIKEKKCALYVAPKLDKSAIETNYIKMLFDAMRHEDVMKHLKDLYTIKWKEPPIEIAQQQDLLTPFLVTEFLAILKQIVRKGLKKSYYKVERKLNSKIKGKINIGKTVKHHLSKQRRLETICTFEEFGVDNLENRVLKKALQFVKRYLPQYHNIRESDYLQNTFNFISPAFHQVSAEVSVRDIQSFKSNAFFKEYDKGLELAKIILKRFGYNISKTDDKKILTPPFWIDMSQLFELYVLGILKDRFGKDVTYHFSTYGNELDYLLNTDEYKMVIDAKYKPKYEASLVHEDIRQVSGYARLKKTYDTLKVDKKTLIDCLIIYPNQKEGLTSFEGQVLNADNSKIEAYIGVYKLSVQLPKIEK